MRIQDLRFEPGFERRLRSFEPAVVGISCLYTSHVGATWDLARRAKWELPGVKVVVGGQPPTLAPHLFRSPDIDVIVRGDGEAVMPALCRALERGEPLANVRDLVFDDGETWSATERTKKPKDLSEAPRPDRHVRGVDRSRHFLAFARPIALMEVNRGCPFDCNFCSIWKMGEGRLRSRRVDEAVEEIASIPERDVFFTDDHFFANPQLMLELGQALVAAGLDKTFKAQSRADVFAKHPELIDTWMKAGLREVFLGLEGHSDARLDEVKKRTDVRTNERAVDTLLSAGLNVSGNLMIDPGFTKEDFEGIRDYVQARNLHFAAFCIGTPFPGTDWWESCSGDVATTNFDLYDIQHAVVKTHLPLEEFYEEYARCWARRATMQPPARRAYELKRIAGVLLKEGLRFELLKNVRRFEQDVVDPAAYLADHAAAPIHEISWEPATA